MEQNITDLLAEAKKIFHNSLITDVINDAEELLQYENTIILENNHLSETEKKEELAEAEERLARKKKEVAESESEFADSITGLDNLQEESEVCLCMAKLYYRMETRVKQLSSKHTISMVTMLEKSVSFIDRYKQLHPEVKCVVFEDVLLRFHPITECDVRELLADKYHFADQNDNAIACLDNLFVYYASEYGRDSAEYATRLCRVMMSVNCTSRLAFIEKWADATATAKEYAQVWGIAADSVPMDSIGLSPDEFVVLVRKKVAYLEHASVLDPDVYQHTLRYYKNKWNEFL